MTKKSAWALICLDEKYLFTQRSESTSRSGQWCPPGGGVQASESPEDSCVREVLEEVGLAVTIDDLVSNDEGFCYFRCRLTESTPLIVLAPRECSDFQWVQPQDLLQLGPIMEFKRMQRVFLALGLPIRLDA
jgi:8-oxo-dGTP pyrophosphatase MutT (NUDIX family)